MPNPPNSPEGSDIGPLPPATSQGAVPASGEGGAVSQPKPEAAVPGARKVQPDVASPLVKAREEPEPESPAAGTQSAPHPTANQPWPEIDCANGYEEANTAITNRMKAKYGATLVDDMDDAQMLLSYLTRNGLQEERKIEDKTIQSLIAARYRLRSGLFDCEKEEAEFRKNYGIIAKAAAPVTVASLRDSLPTKPERRWGIFQEGEPRSIAERKCFKYRDAALLVLLALLIFQIYWTISSAVLKKTDEIISELNKAPTEAVYRAREELARQKAAKLANQQVPVESTSSKPTPPPATSSQASPPQTNPPPAKVDKTQLALDEAVSKLAEQDAKKVDKTELTLDELVSKLAEQDANYEMLSGLMKPMARIFFPRTLSFFETPALAVKGGKEQKDVPASTTPPEDKPAASPTPTDKEKASQEKDDEMFTPSRFQRSSATIRAVAGQVIDVMQKWLLPLLYGALGAMVFVVRTLSIQARDRLFRKEALVSLILRVYLGMISGLAIGWFWSQDTKASGASGPMSLATLSPFALAFIAGYGVELFFTLLDKIISTFTNKT